MNADLALLPTNEYKARIVRFVRAHSLASGPTLKLYEVYTGRMADPEVTMQGLRMACGFIPQLKGHHGFAVVIVHHGDHGDYLTVMSWMNGDQMQLTMWESPKGENRWQPMQTTLCPWDIRVLAFEADQWRTHVLQGRDAEGYLGKYIDLEIF